MDNKLVESYFDVIAEQIVDENKIVTYKSLSKSLGIHVNTAKQLLCAYLNKEKYKNSFPLSATYLVAGRGIDGSFNITVVNEADLKNCYTNFREISSEHVYSVQKGKTLNEVKVLSGIGQELTNFKSSNLVIKHSKSVINVKDEVGKKHDILKKQNKEVIRQALVPEGQKNIAAESKTKIESINHKITSESPKKSRTKEISVKNPTNIKKPFGNIASLFAKASQKNTNNTIIDKKSEINFKNVPKEVDIAVLDQIKEVDWDKSESNTIKMRGESKNSLRGKKKGNKRKRIQLLSDSEEYDSNDGTEEDSFLLDTNLEEKVEEKEKVIIKESIPRSKKKKRKIVDRTVMNENGYLETKKEIVFETDSENEPEEIAMLPEEPNKLNIVKNKGVQGVETAKKQSSLLTFFKKT